jgi:hypothetical protein
MERAKDATKGAKKDLNDQVVYELFKKYTYLVEEVDQYRSALFYHLGRKEETGQSKKQEVILNEIQKAE